MDTSLTATILRDAYGVPHIFADTEAAALYAFGYAQAEDRLATLLAHYLAARGQSASLLGESALERDIAARAFRLPEFAVERYGELSAEVREGIEAFAAGVNRYQEDHSGKRPPFAFEVTPQDVVALSLLYNLYFADDHFEAGPSQRGSNGFAVAAERTANGKAIVSLDPHLPFEGALRWYEGHVCGGAMNVYGVTFAGIPYIVMGCNGRVAWANTVNDPDLSDLYEIRLRAEPDTIPTYEYEGRMRPAEVHTYQFAVRGAGGMKEVSQTIVSTHHGPILKSSGDRRFAVRKAGIGDVHVLSQVRAQCLAASVDDYREALAGCHVAMFNHLFGDADGAIGYVSAGQIPRRPDGFDFHAPVRGWDSATEWGEPLEIDELPQAMRPANGWVQNCNDAPQYCCGNESHMTVPGPYHEWIAPDIRTLRGVRMAELLAAAGESLTTERAMAIATDTKDLNAASELSALIAAAQKASLDQPRLAECIHVLSDWDGELRADSRGAALFQVWLLQPAIAMMLPVGRWVTPNYRQHWPVAQVDPAGAVAAISDAADWLRAYGFALDVSWGELHRLARGGVDLPFDGGLDSLCPASGRVDEASGKVVAQFGSSYRCLAEPSGETTRLWACLPWGNSDDPSSPHFADQLPLAARRGYRVVPWTREQVEAEVTDRKTL